MGGSCLLYLSRTLRITGTALLLAVIAGGPFFRGLFFWYELLVGIGIVGLGFALWALGRRLGNLPLGLPGGFGGWALLALLLCYVAQFPWAVYFRGNLDWVLRAMAAWLTYVLLRGEAGPLTRRWVGWVVLASATAVAVVGLLDFTGYFATNPQIAASLKLVGLSDRLFTVYQYPNTAAAVFMAAVLVGIGVALADLRPWRMAVAGAAAGIIAVAFFFTLSRGAVVVLPFGLLFLLIGLDRARVWQAIWLLGGMFVAPIALSMQGIARYVPAHNWPHAMRWALVAAVAGAGAGFVLGYLFRLKFKLQATLLCGLAAIAIVGLLLIRPAGPLVPKMAERLLDMNFKTVNVVLRLIYDRDAVQIVAQRPLGSGGGGWERNYPRVQDFSYFARETHDHFAQTAVEAGVPGLLALLAALGGSLWLAFRTRHADPLKWAMASAAAVIAAHALIDFDLSFGQVWLLLWVLLATTAPPPTGKARRTPWVWIAAPALGVAVAGLSAWLAVGAWYVQRSTAYLDQANPDAALTAAKRSLHYDPWNSQPLLLLGTKDTLQAGARVDRRNMEIWRQLALKYEAERNYTAAYTAATNALANQPAVSANYDAFARLAGFRLEAALSDGDLALARTLGQELTRAAHQFVARKAVADPLQHWWPGRAMQWSNLLYLHFGKGLYLTGDAVTAERYLKLASREWASASEAEVWLYAMYTRAGRTADLVPLEQKPWIRFRNANPTFKALLNWQ